MNTGSILLLVGILAVFLFEAVSLVITIIKKKKKKKLAINQANDENLNKEV